jgi:hypothetical protein
MPTITSRDQLVRRWDTGGSEDVHAIIYIFDYTEFSGAEFSLDWPAGWGSTAFEHCADLNIGNIVNPGDGVSLTWLTCFEDPTASTFTPIALAWLAVSGEADIVVDGHPQHDSLLVLDCGVWPEGAQFEPDSVFQAAINKPPYQGDYKATEAATWGAIKALFR